MSTPFPVCLEGKVLSVSNQMVEALHVTDEYAFATLQISAVNDTVTGVAKIRVAISDSADPFTIPRADFIEVADELKPGGRYTNFGVLIPSGKYVYVGSDTGNVIFRATALAHSKV